jgi:catechol 2,3-dioxygenase-like lactoylglutathione lyase family enzyme
MPLSRLDHVNIRAHDLEATRDFYVEVLGLREGARPAFSFPGYWLYLGDQAVVHLIGQRSDRVTTPDSPTGNLDHVAFVGSDMAGLVARLESRGIPMKTRQVPGLAIDQVFVQDPNGITIELNFPTGAAAPLLDGVAAGRA